MFCHVKNSPNSEQQNSNKIDEIGSKSQFHFGISWEYLCCYILNQLLNNCYFWLERLTDWTKSGLFPQFKHYFFWNFCVHWFQWSEKKFRIAQKELELTSRMRSGEDLKRHFNMQVQSHFEIEFINGNSLEGQRQGEKSVQKVLFTHCCRSKTFAFFNSE